MHIDVHTHSWDGDQDGDHCYYQKGASHYWSYIEATGTFGTEVSIPYYTKNGEKANCYQEQMFWFGISDHIFVQQDISDIT